MKAPVHPPPYLDASTRAAGGKHGGNDTHTAQSHFTQQALPVLYPNPQYSVPVSF